VPASRLLEDFRHAATDNPADEILMQFPEAAVAATIENTWQKSASRVYRNWLEYLTFKKAETPSLVALAPVIRA
jgi:homoserine trans-succinylase